jgi:hypothetical protein
VGHGQLGRLVVTFYVATPNVLFTQHQFWEEIYFYFISVVLGNSVHLTVQQKEKTKQNHRSHLDSFNLLQPHPRAHRQDGGRFLDIGRAGGPSDLLDLL